MKKKKHREGFYIRLNGEEAVIVEILKNKYSINISGVFKNFLRQYLEHLDKFKGICDENENMQ